MPKSFGSMLELARIQSEINRLFDNLLDLGKAGSDPGQWTPNADILETPDRLLVQVELPGVEPEALEVCVNGGNLLLNGRKAGEPQANVEKHVSSERSFGSFSRSINLGVPVNTRQARALLEDGLLRIEFPKVPNRRGEDVPIEVESR